MSSFKAFLDSIDSLDQYGYQIRPDFYWLPESKEDEIKRLEMNLAIYQEFIKNGSRFPGDINNQRTVEYKRIRELRRVWNEVV